MSQSDTTPPPCPPSAAMVTVMGLVAEVDLAVVLALAAAMGLSVPLGMALTARAPSRCAQAGGRSGAAGMIPRTNLGIDAEALAPPPLALLGHALQHGRDAPLAIQLALALRDDDLGSLIVRRQGFAQRVDAFLHLVRMDCAHPIHTHAAHGPFDRIAALSILHISPRRGNVLAARGRGIAVVHDDGDGIVLVEHGIADAAGQAVMPEAPVPHDGYGTPASLAAAQSRAARGPQPIAHDARTRIERRQR